MRLEQNRRRVRYRFGLREAKADMSPAFRLHDNGFETYSTLHARAGGGRELKIDLFHGLTLLLKEFQPGDTVISEGDHESQLLAFDFCISGESRCLDPLRKGKMIVSKPGRSYLAFCPGVGGELECVSDENVVFVSAVIEPSVLTAYLHGQPKKFPAGFTALLNGDAQIPYIYQGETTAVM